jgi:FlaG/FlaF family flagellin (archaellin)
MVMPEMQDAEHAVSPVVGVMLMLVVTIIIAAVVSSFSTSLAGEVETGSNAQVELVGISSGGYKNVPSPPPWTYAQIGVVFRNAGGDTLDLRNLKYSMTGIGWSTQGVFTMTYNDPVSLKYVEDSGEQSGAGKWRVTLPKEATGYRMQKFGSGLTLEELEDPILEPGEQFIIYCEYFQPAGKPTSWEPIPSAKLGFACARGGAGWSSGAVNVDGGSEYELTDVKTGIIYTSGYLEQEHLF